MRSESLRKPVDRAEGGQSPRSGEPPAHPSPRIGTHGQLTERGFPQLESPCRKINGRKPRLDTANIKINIGLFKKNCLKKKKKKELLHILNATRLSPSRTKFTKTCSGRRLSPSEDASESHLSPEDSPPLLPGCGRGGSGFVLG